MWDTATDELAVRVAKRGGMTVSELLSRLVNSEGVRKVGIAHRFPRHPSGGSA